MKFGSWCSKGQAILRNLRRFWPAMVGFGLILAMVLIQQDLSQPIKLREYNGDFGEPWFFAYGFLCALLLMLDNFNSRYGRGVQGFPQTREDRFLGQVLSGLVLFLIPTVLCFGLVVVKTNYELVNPLIWLGLSAMTWLLTFSVGMLASTISGTVFGAILTASILVGGVPMTHTLLDDLVNYTLPGVVWGLWYAPTGTLEVAESAQAQEFWAVSWAQVVPIVAVSLLCLLLALVLYRRRATEQSGNFLAFPKLKPVMKLLCTGLGGMLLGVVLRLALNLDDTVAALPAFGWLLPAVLMARLVAEMVVEKTARIFSGRQLLHYGLCAVAVAGLILCLHLDPFALETKLPEQEDVVSVEVSIGYPSAEFTTPENIDAVLALHQQCIDYREHDRPDLSYAYMEEFVVEFSYTLKNGRLFLREYQLNLPVSWDDYANGKDTHPMLEYLDTFQNSTMWFFGCVGAEPATRAEQLSLLMANTKTLTISRGWDELHLYTTKDPEMVEQVLSAFLEDLEQGKVILDHKYRDENEDYYTLLISSSIEEQPEGFTLDRRIGEKYFAHDIYIPAEDSATALLLENLPEEYQWNDVSFAYSTP